MTIRRGVARVVLALWTALLVLCLAGLWLGQTGLAGAAEATASGPARVLELSLNTLYTAGLALVVSTAWALPAALCAAFLVPSRWRSVMAGLAVAPAFAAPAVIAVSGVRLLGAQGPLTLFVLKLHHALTGAPIPTVGEEVIRGAPIFSLTATGLLLAVAFLPVAFLALWSGLRRVDPDSIEAALLEGGLGAALRHVIAPLAAGAALPGLAALFLLAATEFSIPESLRSQPVLVTEVYNKFQVSYDARAALFASLPLIGGVLLVLVPLARFSREAGLGGDASRWSPRSPLARRVGLLQPAALALVALPILAIVAPLVATLDGPNGPWQVMVVTWNTVQEEMRLSLGLAAGGAGLCAVVGVLLGVSLRSLRRPTPARLALLFGFIVPAPVVAVGIKMLVNLPPGALPFGLAEPLARLDPTYAPLLLAWSLRLVALTALPVEAAVRRVPREWEESAALESSGFVAAFRTYGWHALRPALAAGAVLTFALLLGEAGASLILIPPGTTTLAVRLLTLMHFAPTGQISALSLFLLLPVLPAAVGVALAAGMRAESTHRQF